jgi:hypothetical protein
MQSVRHNFPTVTKIGIYQQILLKFPTVECHENPFSSSRVITCRQTEGHMIRRMGIILQLFVENAQKFKWRFKKNEVEIKSHEKCRLLLNCSPSRHPRRAVFHCQSNETDITTTLPCRYYSTLQHIPYCIDRIHFEAKSTKRKKS